MLLQLRTLIIAELADTVRSISEDQTSANGNERMWAITGAITAGARILIAIGDKRGAEIVRDTFTAALYQRMDSVEQEATDGQA